VQQHDIDKIQMVTVGTVWRRHPFVTYCVSEAGNRTKTVDEHLGYSKMFV